MVHVRFFAYPRRDGQYSITVTIPKRASEEMREKLGLNVGDLMKFTVTAPNQREQELIDGAKTIMQPALES